MGSMSSIPDIVNEEEHEYQDCTTDLGNWNIPKFPVKEIYKTSFLEDTFKTDQVVKTVEQIMQLQNNKKDVLF